MATSACEAPPIMFGTKLLWPGASSIVKCLLSVSKNARPTSTVLPLSRSSRLVSSAHDRYLNAGLTALHCTPSMIHTYMFTRTKCNFSRPHFQQTTHKQWCSAGSSRSGDLVWGLWSELIRHDYKSWLWFVAPWLTETQTQFKQST